MKPNVFEFENFGNFLRQTYRAKKQKDSGFSFRVMARSLGIKSPSLLAMVAKGDRKASQELAVRLGRYLDLNLSERDYLSALIGFESARTTTSREHYAERLRNLRPRSTTLMRDLEQFEMISTWYHFAILELVEFSDFSEDPQWIANRLRPRVSTRVAKEALSRLEKQGLLVRENGRLKRTHAELRYDPKMASLAVRKFHLDHLENAKNAIEALPLEQRILRGLTFSVRLEDLPKAQEIIKTFMNELRSKLQANANKADAVVHCGVQIFPLSQTKKERVK